MHLLLFCLTGDPVILCVRKRASVSMLFMISRVIAWIISSVMGKLKLSHDKVETISKRNQLNIFQLFYCTATKHTICRDADKVEYLMRLTREPCAWWGGRKCVIRGPKRDEISLALPQISQQKAKTINMDVARSLHTRDRPFLEF